MLVRKEANLFKRTYNIQHSVNLKLMDTLLVPRKFEVSVKENVYPHVGLYTAMERTFTHLLACKPQWSYLYQWWRHIVCIWVEIHGTGDHVEEDIHQCTRRPLNPSKRTYGWPIHYGHPHMALRQAVAGLREETALKLD